jgi:hypothetical protein
MINFQDGPHLSILGIEIEIIDRTETGRVIENRAAGTVNSRDLAQEPHHPEGRRACQSRAERMQELREKFAVIVRSSYELNLLPLETKALFNVCFGIRDPVLEEERKLPCSS